MVNDYEIINRFFRFILHNVVKYCIISQLNILEAENDMKKLAQNQTNLQLPYIKKDNNLCIKCKSIGPYFYSIFSYYWEYLFWKENG